MSPVEWSNVTVANGACEFCSCWLEAGQTVRWTVTLRSGSDGMKVCSAFVIDETGATCDEREEVLAASSADEPAALSGSHTAEAKGGVFWLCLDNVSAYWYARTCAVVLQTAPA